MNKEAIIIFTDGVARRNGKPNSIGSWAAVMSYKGQTKEFSGAERETTNNIQELKGAINALKQLKKTNIPVEIHVDSAYVLNGITSWISGWKAKGWVTKGKQPVKNVELWKELDELNQKFESITWKKVKGHSDNAGNNRADELVNLAMDELEINV